MLVLGGSLGAKTLNEVLFKSLSLLDKLGVKVRHQIGRWEKEKAYKVYENFPQHAVEEFIKDMYDAYKEATFVVSRAGATTLSELSCLGRGALLVPYPFAVGDHQRLNALSFVRAGGGLVIENKNFKEDVLIKVLMRLLSQRKRVVLMAKRAKGTIKVCNIKSYLERVSNELSVS